MNMKLVISLVGGVCISSVVGIIVLALASVTIPDTLTTLAIASLTGLVGLLARPDDQSGKVAAPHIPQSASAVKGSDPWER